LERDVRPADRPRRAANDLPDMVAVLVGREGLARSDDRKAAPRTLSRLRDIVIICASQPGEYTSSKGWKRYQLRLLATWHITGTHIVKSTSTSFHCRSWSSVALIGA